MIRVEGPKCVSRPRHTRPTTHTCEWWIFTESIVFERMVFSANFYALAPFMASPSNRLQTEEVGIPIWDY